MFLHDDSVEQVCRAPACATWSRSSICQCRRSRPMTNQATKHVEKPQTHHVDKVVDLPVLQRQVPQFQAVLKTGDFPSTNQGTKHAEPPQIRCVDTVVDITVGDAATGPSNSDSDKDGGRPARAVYRQICGRACDLTDEPHDQVCRDPASGDAATGPSNSENGEDSVIPARVVHQQICGRACDLTD